MAGFPEVPDSCHAGNGERWPKHESEIGILQARTGPMVLVPEWILKH